MGGGLPWPQTLVTVCAMPKMGYLQSIRSFFRYRLPAQCRKIGSFLTVYVHRFGALISYRPFLSFLVLYVALMGNAALGLYLNIIDVRGMEPKDLREIIISLGALLGVPFLVWRTLIAWQQADAVKRSNIKQRIATAAEQLSAVQERRIDDTTISTFPDYWRRVAGLLELESAMHEDPSSHIQIVNLISLYVRESAAVSDSLLSGDEEALGLHDEVQLMRSLRNASVYSNSLPTPRADIQTAIDILGRRPERGRKLERMRRYRLDLSNADLRNVKFTRLYGDDFEGASADFEQTDFRDSVLDGCYACEVNFTGCDFSRCGLIGAEFLGSSLRGCTFDSVRAISCGMNSCDLKRSQFETSCLDGLNLDGADLRWSSFMNCEMRGANLFLAKGQFCTIFRCNLYRSKLNGVDFSGGAFLENNILRAEVFRSKFINRHKAWVSASQEFAGSLGDEQTELEADVVRPKEWGGRG